MGRVPLLYEEQRVSTRRKPLSEPTFQCERQKMQRTWRVIWVVIVGLTTTISAQEPRGPEGNRPPGNRGPGRGGFGGGPGRMGPSPTSPLMLLSMPEVQKELGLKQEQQAIIAKQMEAFQEKS